jgi:hypothetical protein
MSGRRVRPLRVTEAEVPELARRLRNAINAENALFESLGEEPLSGEELKQLTKDVARRLSRGERAEHARGEVFSETESAQSARGLSRSSSKPLHEMAPEERRRAAIEASDELLPDLATGAASAPTPSPAKPPHELYRDDKAAWHQWKRESADRLLPSDPVTGAPPDPRRSE